MKIPLHELSEEEKVFSFTQNEGWVKAAVLASDEEGADAPEWKGYVHPTPGKPLGPKNKALDTDSRPISAEFRVRLVDGVVLLDGDIDTYLRLLCSRCGVPFHLNTQPQFHALYSRDRDLAGVGQSSAKHHNEDDDQRDLEITYLEEDAIDLGQILTEQLMLQVPFRPLPSEGCNGVCLNCGTDLNLGRCACDRIRPVQDSPFAALKNLNLKEKSHGSS